MELNTCSEAMPKYTIIHQFILIQLNSNYICKTKTNELHLVLFDRLLNKLPILLNQLGEQHMTNNIIENTYTALANTGELHLTEKDYSTN